MSKSQIPYKIYLTEEEIPKAWYNIRADMKTDHRPILHPGTLQPMKAEELAPVFCDYTSLARLFLGAKCK